MKSRVLPVFLPFEGCLNKCIFCNQNSITKIKGFNDISDAELQIIKYLKYSSNWNQISFYGGSFSCIDKEKRAIYYDLARRYDFKSIRFSTRPDCIDESMLEEFQNNFVDTIELGVQSLDNNVLSANLRTYTKNDVLNAVNILKDKVDIVIQLMPGIYKESFETFCKGVKSVKELNISAVRLYPCIVIKNTKLQLYYERNLYKPLELWEAIMLCGYAYVLFEVNKIKVIRMGLPVDMHDSEIVAGPIHNAFGDLVKTFILLLFCNINNSGLKLPYELSGYKSLVRKNYPEMFVKDTTLAIWYDIIIKVKESFFENNGWYLQRKTIEIAKKCQDTADNG